MSKSSTCLGFCLHVLDGHIGIVRCLYLQGNLLISGGDRKRIITWDTKVSVSKGAFELHPESSS